MKGTYQKFEKFLQEKAPVLEKVMEYLQLLITDIDCGYWFHSKIKVEVKK